MNNKIIDDVFLSSRKYTFKQESYWILLIAIFIWIVTSFTVGIQGFLPCIFDMKRIISIGFCALIFTLSAIGLKKAMLSKKAGEVRSKELKIGYTGNLIIVVIFALINFNNAFDIYLFLKGDYN